MAAPITHIVLSEKVFDKYFNTKSRSEFFVGTSFPDIRYIGVVDRDKTHYNDLTVADIKNEESFMAGAKFHSILDIVREKFIVDNDIYSLCPQSKYITQSLKILEDEILYSRVKSWEAYIGYFDEILDGERAFGIAEEDLRKWHKILQRYFQKQPDESVVKEFTLGIGLSEEIAREIIQNIAVMKTDERVIKAIEKLYDDFELILEH